MKIHLKKLYCHFLVTVFSHQVTKKKFQSPVDTCLKELISDLAVVQFLLYLHYLSSACRLQEIKSKRKLQTSSSKRQVILDAYRRLSLPRGSKYSDPTWKTLQLFWLLMRVGCLQELVPNRGLTVVITLYPKYVMEYM